MNYSLLLQKKLFSLPLKGVRSNVFGKSLFFRNFNTAQYKNCGYFGPQRGCVVKYALFSNKFQGRYVNGVRNLSNAKKLNKSEVRRLLSLAKPERWKLLGVYCD